MLTMFVLYFLPCLSFSSMEQVSFNFMAVVIIHSDFGAQENKICYCLHFSPSICHEVMGLDAVILVFWMLSFKPGFSLSSFNFIKRVLSSSLLSAIRVVHIWDYWYFSWQSWFQLVFHPLWHFTGCTLHIGRRKWQPTPVFLPGKSHGQRSLVGQSSWGHRVRHDWVTNTWSKTDLDQSVICHLLVLYMWVA